MKTLISKQIVFLGGKGGVGKTTMASALALRGGREGKRTLLVSTDPAHNLSDIFQKKIANEPSFIKQGVWAMEIDSEEETSRYIRQVKNHMTQLVSGRMLEEMEKQVDLARLSPGSDEAALFDRMVELIEWGQVDFDLIIFDTAPTGHTLRLLSLPEMMGAWVDGMLQRRKKIAKMREVWLEETTPSEDPIYEILVKRKLKFTRAREVLMDPRRTGFSFVLTPERLPIAETGRAVRFLEKYGVPVDTLIINRILPDETDGQFLLHRKEQEKKYIDEIESCFSSYRLIKVPLLVHDVCGLEPLQEIEKYLF